MGIRIITDTSSDLNLAYVKENSDVLTVLGMPIEMGGEAYVDDLGETFSHDVFYEHLRSGGTSSTSQISPDAYRQAYKSAIEAGDDVIVIGLSSGLSSTINNATLAKHMVEEHHKAAKITVVDTLAGSIGLGMLVHETIGNIRTGIDYEPLVQWVETTKLKVNHWFAIDDLNHLKRGGRIPPAMAVIGTALKVKPILTIRHNGKLESYAKVRGRNKSVSFLVSKLEEHIGDCSHKTVMIGHGDCEEDAIKLKEAIKSAYDLEEVIISRLSQTIGTHVGPGMLAISFIGDTVREDIT